MGGRISARWLCQGPIAGGGALTAGPGAIRRRDVAVVIRITTRVVSGSGGTCVRPERLTKQRRESITKI